MAIGLVLTVAGLACFMEVHTMHNDLTIAEFSAVDAKDYKTITFGESFSDVILNAQAKIYLVSKPFRYKGDESYYFVLQDRNRKDTLVVQTQNEYIRSFLINESAILMTDDYAIDSYTLPTQTNTLLN